MCDALRSFLTCTRVAAGGRLIMGAAVALVIGVSTAVAAAFELHQKRGRTGCVAHDGARGECLRGLGLKLPEAVVVSPDGRQVYAAAHSGGVSTFDRRAVSGALQQKPGFDGCISQTVRLRNTCRRAHAMRAPIDLAISPDGRHVYVAAMASDSVAILTRDARSGQLSQSRGRSGCVSRAKAGSCARARALDGPHGITISADGRNVYVVAYSAANLGAGSIVVFDRDPHSGALTQKAGAAGCVNSTIADCGVSGDELDGAMQLTLSADGKNAYVAGIFGVVILDRDVDGALTIKEGRDGCVGDGEVVRGCAIVKSLEGPVESVAVSADDKHVYVAAFGGVTLFSRDPAGGRLSHKRGAMSCLSARPRSACTRGRSLAYPVSVALSPDGLSAYVVSIDSSALAMFARDPRSGVLRQRPAAAGCVSEARSRDGCMTGRGLSNPHDVTVSPDGRSVYSTSSDDSAIATFTRRPGA